MNETESSRATGYKSPAAATDPTDEHASEHARRRERDADAARRAILAAAAEIFARDGFDGARIDAIAETAGYNKSLIFQYFGDKLALYQTVVAGMKQRVEEELGGILAPYTSGPASPQRVRRFVEEAMRWSFDHYRTRPCDRAILIWETAEGWRTFNCIATEPRADPGADQSANPGASAMPMRWHLVAADFLRRAQAAGVVRADLDADVLLAIAMGMALFYIASLPRFRLMYPDADFSAPAALDRAREQLVGLMLHGTMTPAALAASALPGLPGTDCESDDHESFSSTEEASDATGL